MPFFYRSRCGLHNNKICYMVYVPNNGKYKFECVTTLIAAQLIVAKWHTETYSDVLENHYQNNEWDRTS